MQDSISASDRIYVFLASMFVVILVLTNVIGTKLFVAFGDWLPNGFFGNPFVLTSGIITYPLTFWLTDIVSEIWGKKKADLMVIYGFVASVIMLLVLMVAKHLPPASIWTIPADQAVFFNPELYVSDAAGSVTGVSSAAAQAAYAFTFDAPGTLLLASMVAYLVAQLFDIKLFHFWKRLTAGKHLWLRNNGSTMISQLVDTIIVNGIFLYFYWEMPWFESSAENPVTIVQVILTAYVFKVVMALLDTPLIYAGVYLLKKKFRLEVSAS